jgi:cytosine/adenosine deaminase-related metal-dependent hydrolase
MSYFSHLKSGTTTVAEFSLPLNDKTFGHILHAIERTEVRSVVALQNWDQITKAREPGSGRHRFVLNAGREEDFNVYGFENLIRSARELKVPMLAHVAEQRADVELVRRNFQKTILGVLQDYTVVSPETVFVHLNHLSSSEVEVLADCGATAVVCAWSGALKRTGYPALRHLAAQRIRLAIGTDWANVDMLAELKFLQQLHLLISSIPPFSPLQLVRMATVNGAHALGLSHETGSIEAGKKADLTFFSLADMRLPVISEFADAESLASLLVNHLHTRDVTDVMIDGEFYVAQGHVMTMAEEEVVDGFRRTYAKYYEDEAKKIPPPPLPAIEEPPTRAKHKVLPFVAQGRAAQPLEEGFESGFQPVEKPPTVIEIRTNNINVEPPTQTPPATIKESPRPRQEPSKEIWRTFGDDEEF